MWKHFSYLVAWFQTLMLVWQFLLRTNILIENHLIPFISIYRRAKCSTKYSRSAWLTVNGSQSLLRAAAMRLWPGKWGKETLMAWKPMAWKETLPQKEQKHLHCPKLSRQANLNATCFQYLLSHLSIRWQLTSHWSHIYRVNIGHQWSNKTLKMGSICESPHPWLVKWEAQPSLFQYNSTPSYSFSDCEWSLKCSCLSGESKRGKQGNGLEQEEKNNNNNAMLWKGRLDSSFTSETFELHGNLAAGRFS